MRQPFGFHQQRGIEGDLIEAAHDLLRGRRDGGALHRRDLHDQQLRGLARDGQLIERRIGGIAAVPIGFVLDRHGVMQQRQAGRGDHRIDGDLVIAENPRPAVGDARRRDEEADRPLLAQPLEIDFLVRRIRSGLRSNGLY